MFDRVDRSHKDGDTVINVKQQPNDSADAARLYGEMVAKAQDEVARVAVEKFGAFNELTVLAIAPERSFETEKMRVRLLFKLNGHMYDFWVDDADMVRDQAMSVVAQALVSQVLNKIFTAGKRP